MYSRSALQFTPALDDTEPATFHWIISCLYSSVANRTHARSFML